MRKEKIKVFESEDAREKCQQYESCEECPYSHFPANFRYRPECRLPDVSVETYEEDEEGFDWFL